MRDSEYSGAPFPGLYRPGLIEAFIQLDVMPVIKRRFPGLYRPGLIEANHHQEYQQDKHRFPGLYRPGLIEALAGAGRRRRASTFPGLYRPGLIEAWATRARSTSPRPFPGLYRPGLIEARAVICPPSLGSSCFRGFTAPASLKLAQDAGGLVVDGAAFPGLYRPGLIEAPRCAPRRAGGRTVSGALPPRPH